MEEKNKTQDARNIKGMDEDQFQAELAELMKEEPGGKKKKGKKARRQRKPWSKKRKVITAAALILIVAAGFKVFGGEKEKTVMVSTSALIKGTIQEELTISGPVSGTDSVDVVSNLHAEVTDIRVKEGDRVEEGQVLAVIDDSDKVHIIV